MIASPKTSTYQVTSRGRRMSFTQFQSSARGEAVAPVLRSAAAIGRMEAFSRAGRPALLAVAAEIEQVAPTLTDTEKQHVGRWVHRLLGPRGWRPVEKKRLPKGSLFTTAAVYAHIGLDHPAGAGPKDEGQGCLPASEAATERDSSLPVFDRFASARARVAALPVRPISVASFVAEKRREARRDVC